MLKKIFYVLAFFTANISFANSVNIRAIVGDEIITSYDVDQRKKLATALLKHSKINMPEAQIEKNVLNEMIEDKLKIAEARKYGITATKDEIESAKSRMVQLLNLGADGYDNILKEAGVSQDILNEQIRGDVIWSKFVMQVLRGYIKVQDSEVTNYIENAVSDNMYEFTLIPFMLKNEDDFAKVKDVTDCAEFEKLATTYGNSGSGFKMNIINSQMQKSLYDITKTAPVSTALNPIELNGEKTVFFICDKKAYVPTVSTDEKEKIKFMIYQNKLDAYANKYFEKIKATSLIDIKE